MGRIQSARWDGLIRRLFSVKGGGSLLAETLGDAFPVVQLEGGPIELLKLSGWQLGSAGGLFTSPVGQTAGWQLLNPAQSGKLVIPTSLWFAANADATVFMGQTTVALATATVGRDRDTRDGVLSQVTAQARSGNNPAPPANAGRLFASLGVQQKISDSDGLAVLAPGTALTFVSVATNLQVRFAFLWRERVAESSELNF